jgi:hypothetical protein
MTEDWKKKIYNINIPYNYGGVLDTIARGSLFDQVKAVVKEYPYHEIMYALTELCIETEVESCLKHDQRIQSEKGLSDEEFEKYSIIIGLNNVEKFFERFLETKIDHITNSKERMVKEKIQYLIDKYGENFQDGLPIKLNSIFDKILAEKDNE